MTRFEVWAPRADRVELDVVERLLPMTRGSGGWWATEVPAGGDTDYAYRLDGGPPLADPRSPRQPYGVTGRSRTYRHEAFGWTDTRWRGLPLPGAVLYELHVGTFSPRGTFDAVLDRLDHLCELGVDAIELMPVTPIPGDRGWGYDGVDLWAVDEGYGGPDGLKRLVDGCHARGIGVLLDVVYNHVGPTGNVLEEYGPYFTRAPTPWGRAVNLDGPGSDEVRAFLIGNALHWLRDYHLDGLRLDAVHALHDAGAVHLLEELAIRVDALAAQLRRPLHLIAESDQCDPRLVTGRQAGGYGLTAQWSDDFHHALHAALTGERHGYYVDFGSLHALATTLTSAFWHDGRYSALRGHRFGRPVDRRTVPAYRFLGYAQTHDQVGNRAAGDRLTALLSPGSLRIAAALVLTAPFTPMLFMGEEWGADTPWCYFCDHRDPALARAIRDGRAREFDGWRGRDGEPTAIPDPQARETFMAAKLDWSQPTRPPYADVLDWYRRLIALRRRRPELTDPRLDRVSFDVDEGAGWLLMHRGDLRLAVNLGPAQPIGIDRPITGVQLASRDGVRTSGATVHLPAESCAVLDT